MTYINVDNNSLDLSQNITNNIAVDLSLQNPIYSGGKVNNVNSNISILSPNGLNFNSSLSNAKLSQEYSITDFTIFNPYIHNDPNPNGGTGLINKISYAFTINTSQFLNEGSSAFNIYNIKYRG